MLLRSLPKVFAFPQEFPQELLANALKYIYFFHPSLIIFITSCVCAKVLQIFLGNAQLLQMNAKPITLYHFCEYQHKVQQKPPSNISVSKVYHRLFYGFLNFLVSNTVKQL